MPCEKQNPWYYIVGVVCLFMALRGVYIYEKMPAKPAIVDATEMKPLL